MFINSEEFEAYCNLDDADDDEQCECQLHDKSSSAASNDNSIDNEKVNSNDGPVKAVGLLAWDV